METKIIIRKNWKTIKTYSFVFTMSSGDRVEFEETEYEVVISYLDVDANEMLILIK
jgi:hypothetical protein